MTCKDCIHYDTCYHIEHYGRLVETDEPCGGFKNKADFVGGSDYQPYGYVRFVPDGVLEDEAFSDELEGTKLFVLEKIIEVMRREAAENPDFFIIGRAKSGDPLTCNSVGLKVYLPSSRRKERNKE